jgi:2'-5' RNA ligase
MFFSGAWFSKHAWCSIQAEVAEPIRSGLLQWAKDAIDQEDLDEEDGLEDNPHITVKYGLADSEQMALQALLSDESPARAKLGELALFESESEDKPDVLYVSVESEDLARLNQVVCRMPHVDTHPVYVAHLTVAYLKKGCGKKYLGTHPYVGHELVFDRLALCDREGKRSDVFLGPGPRGGVVFAQVFEGVTRFADVVTLQQGEGNTREGTINGEPWIEKRARLFIAAEYDLSYPDEEPVIMRYTTDHLDMMVASCPARAVDDENWDVPIQLDHSYAAEHTIGSVREVERLGDELWGWLRFVGEKAVAKVRGCLWRKLSIAHDERYRLTEVSVTPFPRVKTAQVFTTKPKEDSPVADAKGAAQPQNPTPASAVTQPAPAPSAPAEFADPSAIEARLRAEFAEKTKADEARFAEMERQHAAMAKTIRFAEVKSRVEEFSAAGKTTPAMREPELALLESLNDKQLELYAAVKAAQPAIVDFNVYSTVAVKPPEGGTAAAHSDYEAGRAAAAQAMGGK